MLTKTTQTAFALVLAALCMPNAGPQAVTAGAEPLDQANVVVVYQIEGRPDRINSPPLRDNPKVGSHPILDIRFITASAQIQRLAALVAIERKADRNPSICFYPG